MSGRRLNNAASGDEFSLRISSIRTILAEESRKQNIKDPIGSLAKNNFDEILTNCYLGDAWVGIKFKFE